MTSPDSPVSLSLYFLFEPIMTFETKLTIALAGCSGSCSANRWHIFSVSLCAFLATNPKILRERTREKDFQIITKLLQISGHN